MALSEEEQRLLEQMEAAFAAEDPKFADALSGTTRRKVEKRRAALAGLGVIVGIGLLLAGIPLHWTVSILGFLVMLVAVVFGLGAWREHDPDTAEQQPRQRPTAAANNRGFMDRFEERWNRRQNGGDL